MILMIILITMMIKSLIALPLFHLFHSFRSISLLSLYPLPNPSILGWFPEVVSIAQDVLCEEQSTGADGEADNGLRDPDGTFLSIAVNFEFFSFLTTLLCSVQLVYSA